MPNQQTQVKHHYTAPTPSDCTTSLAMDIVNDYTTSAGLISNEDALFMFCDRCLDHISSSRVALDTTQNRPLPKI